VAITGKGVIDGQGRALAANVTENIHKGIVKDLFRNDRPEADIRAMIINFRNCRNVLLRGVTIRNSASWVETYDQCTNLRLDSIHVDSKAFWNNDGVDIVDCDSVAVTNSYIDADDDGICLKSHDATKFCNNVLIRNCTIRSSANAIKFGTASYGGFRNITILGVRVFDTYRSALALEAVDGGFLENVLVDSLQAYNTGNFLYLRIGERVAGKKGRLENVRIQNVHIEVPAGKPDAGYDYEGPIEDMPRNLTPAIVIAGMPDARISGVALENVDIQFAGGGNPLFAKIGVDELDKVPERANAYPDFSMFKELPSWGAYIRHAEKIEFRNVRLHCEKKDYRPAIVLDDVHASRFEAVHVKEPGAGKKQSVYQYKSSDIVVK
jgi:polygalacturonase